MISQTLARNRNAMYNTIKRNRTRFINQKKPKKCCANCSHVGAETTSDVACCNCCEDMEFFDQLPESLCIEFED